jgi:hypothetical protein
VEADLWGEAGLVCLGREQGRSRKSKGRGLLQFGFAREGAAACAGCCWLREEKNQPKRGRGAGGCCLGWGRWEFPFFFRVFLPFVLPPPNYKMTHPLCVLKAAIYRQNNVWASKLVPQLSLFCKFWFFDFFFILLYFLKTSNINVDLNEKNQWFLKMTREKSNAFKNLWKLKFFFRGRWKC